MERGKQENKGNLANSGNSITFESSDEMKVIVEANRLFLKVFEDADLDDAMCFWGNEEVMLYCSGSTPPYLLPKVIDSYARSHEEKGISVYAVVEKDSGKVIGAAGFNVTELPGKLELLCHFAKQSWGKGYGTEATLACLNIAEKNGNIETICASADPLNVKSLKVIEKIGFTYQGMKWFDDTKQKEPYYEIYLDKKTHSFI